MNEITRREMLAVMSAAVVSRPLFGGHDPSPYAVVIGTVQDGGLPQVGCYTPRCNGARTTPRFVSSLALVEPADERYFLVDVTPDVTRQLDLLDEAGFRRRAQARRPFDGIFLTHAHIGHYAGLAVLGREGLGMAPTPCYCSPAMADYLSSNGPWSLMVDEGRLSFPTIPWNEWFTVSSKIRAKMIAVPHRPEFSDTVLWMFRGPTATILYLPDIDRWDTWDHDIVRVVAEADVGLLDGTFFSGEEVPGRNIEEIPHPLIPHSMDLLQDTVRAGKRIIFTHMNNTNPALDDDSPAYSSILERGFETAREGMRISL